MIDILKIASGVFFGIAIALSLVTVKGPTWDWSVGFFSGMSFMLLVGSVCLTLRPR